MLVLSICSTTGDYEESQEGKYSNKEFLGVTKHGPVQIISLLEFLSASCTEILLSVGVNRYAMLCPRKPTKAEIDYGGRKSSQQEMQ